MNEAVAVVSKHTDGRPITSIFYRQYICCSQRATCFDFFGKPYQAQA